MKMNQLAIAFLISALVILLFTPLNECRLESITTGGSLQELQPLYSFATNKNNYAASNDVLNFEEKKVGISPHCHHGPLLLRKPPLCLIHISQAVEPQSSALNFLRSPRPPPFNSL